MKLIKLNFRETTSVYINDVKKVACYGNSPQCLKEYIPTRINQDFCVRCLSYYDPRGQYIHVRVKDIKCSKIRLVLEP